MTEASIPPVRECSRYLPGHSIHWIQVRLIHQQPRPRAAVEILDIGTGGVLIAVDDGLRRFQNHDLPRLRAVVDRHGPFGALVGYHALRLESGHLFCIRQDSEGPIDACGGRSGRSDL